MIIFRDFRFYYNNKPINPNAINPKHGGFTLLDLCEKALLCPILITRGDTYRSFIKDLRIGVIHKWPSDPELDEFGDPMFINAARELANDYLVDYSVRVVKLSTTTSIDVFFKFENETIDLQSAIEGDVFPVTLGNYKQYSIQHGYFFFVPFLIKREGFEVTARPIGIHRRSLNAFELKCKVSQHMYELLDGFGIIEEIKAKIAYELLATSFLPSTTVSFG